MLKLMLRQLWKNWFQYLSMFVITTLAATLFLGFIANTKTLRRRSELYLEESNLADLIVQTTGFDESDKAFLEDLSAEYRIYSDGAFAKSGESADRRTAKIFVSDGELHRPYVVEGEKGVLIDKTVANLFGFAIGDQIEIELTAFQSAFERYGLSASLNFEITGLMHSVEGVNVYSNSPVYLSEEAFVVALDAKLPVSNVAESVAKQMYNQALLRCEDYETQKENLQRHFAAKEVNNLLMVFDRDTMESVVVLDSEVEQSKSMLYVFPVIFFLVSILVIMTGISRLILRERIHIGTLKALGLSNQRIVFHYAFTSTLVAFFGCLLGAVLGPLIVPTVMTIKYGLIFSMPKLVGIQFSIPFTVGLTIVVCAVALAIGFWAARSVMKENPAECMRPKQISYTPKVKRGAGRSKQHRHLLLSCRMALRNIRINWARSLMTVIGVMGCSALLLTSFGIGDTMVASIENDYGTLCYFDVSSPFTSAQREELTQTLESLQQSGKIECYENIRQYVATARTATRTKDISVYVLPEHSRMSAIAEGGSTLSRITAQTLEANEGDTLTFTLGGCTVSYTVEDVVSTSTWNGFFTTQNLFSSECYCQESVWVKTDSPEEVKEILNEVNGTGAAKTMTDRREEIENLVSSTNAMKYTLMVFAILLSAVVLYNLSLLNVKDRMRDMATMKVLGFSNFQVSFALIAEIMLLTLVGTAFGAAVGYPLLYLVMKLNEMATMAFIYALTPISYLLSVLGSIATALFINALFGFMISRINMTESLKSVE